MNTENPPNTASLPLHVFSRQGGQTDGARLARWLPLALEQLALCCDGTADSAERAGIASQIADAHVALAGGIWLLRTHGVGLHRFLRCKLADAVIWAVDTVDPLIREQCPSLRDDQLVLAVAGFAMTVFATYDPACVHQLRSEAASVTLLLNTIHTIRSRRRPGRWEAIRQLAVQMSLVKEDELDSESFRREALRLRALLQDHYGLRYALLPPDVPLAFALND